MKTGCTHSCSLKATRAACAAGVNVRSRHKRVDLVQMDKATRRIRRAHLLLCELHGPRRAASYVDRILKGARPGESAVEQPTRFELVFNLRTTKPLGLIIPRSLLARADHVVEQVAVVRALHNLHRRHHKTRGARGAGAASCPYSQSNPWLCPRLWAAAVVTWLA